MGGWICRSSTARAVTRIERLSQAANWEARMDDKPIYDWGQSPPLAPSIKRIDPVGWIVASLATGVVVSLLALALSWRPMPGLAMPPGPLSEHLAYWMKMLARFASPELFADDARFYRKFFLGLGDEQRTGLICRAAFAAWCFFMPAIFLAKPFLRPRDGLIHLRGSRRHSGPEAVKRLVEALRARVERRPDHEIAPGVVYPADMFTRHVLVVAGVGAGKSTALKGLIDKIVASGEQMLLFDPKSEFTIGFARPALIAPWDKRSLSWDIARDMRNLLDMRRFAATMIRESQDPMWSNASRQLLVGLMIYLRATREMDWSWGELRELVALPQAQLLAIMKEWHPEAVRAVEKASVTTAGILINLSSFCSAIFDLAEAWEDVPPEMRVSFVEWTQGRSKFPQIILQGHGAYAELTKSYVEGIVGTVSAIINSVEMEDDPSRKIWFVADEFSKMGRVPGMMALFEMGRSRGLRCVVACQDFAQLEELYGGPMVKALVGMCGTLLVGQIMQGEAAEQLCKAFGSREVERANMSSSHGGAGGGSNRSTTLSYSRDEVALYKPSELSSRLGLTEDGTGVILILFTGGQAYELYWPHYEIRRERAGHVPAPWTLGVTGIVPRVAASRGLEGLGDHQLRTSASSPTTSPMQPESQRQPQSAHQHQQQEQLQPRLPSRHQHQPQDAVSAAGGEHGRAKAIPRTRDALDVETGQAEAMPQWQPESAPAAIGAKGRLGATWQSAGAEQGIVLPQSVEVRVSHSQAASAPEPEAEVEPLADAVADAALRASGMDAISGATVAMAVANAIADPRSGPREEVVPASAPLAKPANQMPQRESGKQIGSAERKPRRSPPV